MKCAIITITDGANYGNRLQNYALQELLKQSGVEVVTLKRRTVHDRSFFSRVKYESKRAMKLCLGRKPNDCGKRLRKKRFIAFNKQYISWGKEVLKNNVAPIGIENQYDYFICGSDQIWNARFGVVNCDLLNHLASFAKPEQRVAYAASFGTNEIVPEYEKTFAQELRLFHAIGVREKSGVEIVRKCCGRNDTKVVLDPTMMLETCEWERFGERPKYINSQNFIVTYFLGGKNQKLNNYIEQIGKRYNAEIIHLDIEFLSDNSIENLAHFSTTPNEFLWLLQNSECILTDSFHATVFSILFNKPFVVFQRIATEKDNNMGSRIDTLLEKFGMTQFVDNWYNPSIIPEQYASEPIEQILNEARKESLAFLRKALGVQSNGEK